MSKRLGGWRKPKKPDHLTLRLAALALAVVLWVVAGQRPPESVGHDSLVLTRTIEVVNVGDDLIVEEWPGEAELVVQGPRLWLMLRAGRTRAYVDLAKKQAGTHRMTVKTRAFGGLHVRQVEPSAVWIVLKPKPSPDGG